MNDLAGTVAAPNEGLPVKTPTCPSIMKYVGSLSWVLDHPPRRFDPNFVNDLQLNLRSYSVCTKEAGIQTLEVSAPAEVTVDAGVLKIFCFLFFVVRQVGSFVTKLRI